MSASIVLDPKEVKALFDTCTYCSEAIVGLYKMVHPDFDTIKAFDGHPSCSKKTWELICGMAMDADRRLNASRSWEKQVLPGGTWLNSGFATSGAEDLADWRVNPTPEQLLKR